jgi:hypothetical protein
MQTDERIPAGAVAVLLENHRRFLRFLERRVDEKALAEDIFREAFTRNVARFDAVGEEAIVPWFYRTLRNAVIDRSRRQGTADTRATFVGGVLDTPADIGASAASVAATFRCSADASTDVGADAASQSTLQAGTTSGGCSSLGNPDGADGVFRDVFAMVIRRLRSWPTRCVVMSTPARRSAGARRRSNPLPPCRV